MNLRKINLNLLVVLDTLLTEKNVSKAARRLFRTQSAVSCSLRQLRELFNDELLVRQSDEMHLTAFAKKIHPELKQLLNQTNNFFNESQIFDYRTSARIFTIGINVYTEQILAPNLYAYIAKHAPNISLKFQRILSPMINLEYFNNDSFDIIVATSINKLSLQLLSEKLITDTYVCVARKNHPQLKKELTLETLAELHYITGPRSSYFFKKIEEIREKVGMKQNASIILTGITATFEILKNSDLAIILPERMVKSLPNTKQLAIKNLPLALPELETLQIWPKYFDNDVGLTWLKDVIRKCFNLS